MRQIKFTMSNKATYILPEDQAREIIDSNKNIVMIAGKNGKWTGDTINKSYLVGTEYDMEATRIAEHEENQYKQIRQGEQKMLKSKKELKKGFGIEDLKKRINKLKK